MLYPIWIPLPRPPHFPDDPRLDRLLASYDPAIGRFKLRMKRRHARALRKGVFGPKGLRQVPDCGGGKMEFRLPHGWTLRLTYHAAGEYDDEGRRFKAGDVDAEFIPPVNREHLARQQEPPALPPRPTPDPPLCGLSEPGRAAHIQHKKGAGPDSRHPEDKEIWSE